MTNWEIILNFLTYLFDFSENSTRFIIKWKNIKFIIVSKSFITDIFNANTNSQIN